MRMKLRWQLFGLVLGVASAAHGYLLPGGSILRRVAEHREDLPVTSLEVEGSATFFGPAAKGVREALGILQDRAEIQLEGAVQLRMPGRCRMEVSTLDGGRLEAFSPPGKKEPEKTPAVVKVAVEEICAILAARSTVEGETRSNLEKHLRELKVETRVTSLGRFGGQVTYVLGDPAEGAPQFWVYKDSFLPARVRFVDSARLSWDVRFLDFNGPATGEWFPRTVEVWSGSELLFRFTGGKAARGSGVGR